MNSFRNAGLRLTGIGLNLKPLGSNLGAELRRFNGVGRLNKRLKVLYDWSLVSLIIFESQGPNKSARIKPICK